MRAHAAIYVDSNGSTFPAHLNFGPPGKHEHNERALRQRRQVLEWLICITYNSLLVTYGKAGCWKESWEAISCPELPYLTFMHAASPNKRHTA